jgi:hypothetical protein
MKKASMISICITTFFYLCCGGFGYAAFGNDTPGNLLTGFGFYEPFWLIDLANVCIIIHLVGGYQVLLLPIKELTHFTIKSSENHLQPSRVGNWSGRPTGAYGLAYIGSGQAIS